MKRLQYSFAAVFAASVALAEVDWTANTIAVNEGTPDNPVVLSDGKTVSAELHIGKNSTGALAISGGAFSNSDAKMKTCVGSGNAIAGYLSVLSGSLSTFHLYVGDAGYGIANVTGSDSSVSSARNLCVGNSAGATGVLMVSDSASISIARECYLGYSGTGRVDVVGSSFKGRGIYIGNNEGSRGVLTLDSGSTLKSVSNYQLKIGLSGSGVLNLAGGSIVANDSGMPLVVRESGSGYGLLKGWGTIETKGKTSNPGLITNNGLVIADGMGSDGVSAERELVFGSHIGAFSNPIENVSTNGWYAVNKGLLTMPHSSNDLPSAGDSGVCTWGEAEDDDAIDLVNSARVTLIAISSSSGISAFTGHLYAADRSDVPALPGGAAAVGVWSFDIDGLYETADFEFRYDHVKAPKGVKIYQLGTDGETWTKLETVGLDGYRAKVSGVAAGAPLMFAAVAASSSGTIVIIR